MTPLDVLWGFLVVVFWLVVVAGVLYGGLLAWCYAADWVEQRQRERRAEIERALDRKQAELRRTVLALADALALLPTHLLPDAPRYRASSSTETATATARGKRPNSPTHPERRTP